MSKTNTQYHTVQEIPESQYIKFHREQQIHDADRRIAALQAEYDSGVSLERARAIDSEMWRLYLFVQSAEICRFEPDSY